MTNFYLKYWGILLFLIYCKGCGIPYSENIESMWKVCMSDEELTEIQVVLRGVEEGDERPLDEFIQETLTGKVKSTVLTKLKDLGRKIEDLVEESRPPSQEADVEEESKPGKIAGPSEASPDGKKSKSSSTNPKNKKNGAIAKVIVEKAAIVSVLKKVSIDNMQENLSILVNAIADYLYKRERIVVKGARLSKKIQQLGPHATKQTPSDATEDDDEDDGDGAGGVTGGVPAGGVGAVVPPSAPITAAAEIPSKGIRLGGRDNARLVVA